MNNQEIKWNKSNFLKSKKGNLIVVNTPSKKDGEYFEGVIIYAKDSETNSFLESSNTYKKNKFELIESKNIEIINHKK